MGKIIEFPTLHRQKIVEVERLLDELPAVFDCEIDGYTITFYDDDCDGYVAAENNQPPTWTNGQYPLLDELIRIQTALLANPDAFPFVKKQLEKIAENIEKKH